MAEVVPRNALHASMARMGFEALKRWASGDETERSRRLDALRELPMLIRRHGLRRTLGFWLSTSNAANEHQAVAQSFALALERLSGATKITLPCSNTEHMLQTQLALELADHWLAMAQAMLAERAGMVQNEASDGRPASTTMIKLPSAGQPVRNAAFEFYHAPYLGENGQVSWVVDSRCTAPHFDEICVAEVPTDGAYAAAYTRWESSCAAAGAQANRKLRFVHRVLIGLSEPSLWETSICLSPVYGTPVIPGSAVKGLAEHFAREHLVSEAEGAMSTAMLQTLFGTVDGCGVVEFQDAWWVPGSAPGVGAAKCRPLVREIVTPHHTDFLNSKGKTAATPFDDPSPVPQLAAHGEFFFAVTGPVVWAEHAMDILQLALEMAGIGARTPEYGQVLLT